MLEAQREWLRDRVDVATWVDDGEEWLSDNLEPLFNLVSDVVTWLVETIESWLTFADPVIVIVLFAAVAWWARSRAFGVTTLIGFMFVDVMNLWDEAIQTLSLVLVASLLAVAVGIPVGLAASRGALVSTMVRPVLDFMQTLPAFVYLIPAVAFFRIGVVPGVVATFVFSMPPAVRLTELGIRQVDREVVEAGEAFGTSPRRILARIQIPLAMPTIMAGINQVIMLALSMVVIAGMVGASGLGTVVYQSVTQLNTGRGFEGGIGVVILAIFLDRVTAGIGQKTTSRVRDRETV